MRRWPLVLLAALLASTAHAQVTSPAPPIIPVTPAAPAFQPPTPPGQATPTAPLPTVQTPSTVPPAPGLAVPGQSPPPSAPTTPDATTPDPAPEPAPAPPNNWQPRGTVEVQALDKVMARSVVLTGKVGDILHFGSLSITVRSCVARPPDEKTDYAAFLDVTDSHVGAPEFHGWMLANEPEISMLQHPLYDIRLTACR
jgi:hypothetical protein